MSYFENLWEPAEGTPPELIEGVLDGMLDMAKTGMDLVAAQDLGGFGLNQTVKIGEGDWRIGVSYNKEQGIVVFRGNAVESVEQEREVPTPFGRAVMLFGSQEQFMFGVPDYWVRALLRARAEFAAQVPPITEG